MHDDPAPGGSGGRPPQGAPEQVVALCDGQRTGDARIALDPAPAQIEPTGWQRMVARIGRGYRTWPDLPAELTPDSVERGLTFLGLVGLMDPPRKKRGEAEALCKSAGSRS